jgi:hypothetical protein
MKPSESNRTFLAQDVYSRWKRVVASAKTNITIFTPYFDRVLLALLNANSTLDKQQIIIVTDFTPDTALELPNQLRTTKKLLSRGISVLSLQGLHAKVLLVDGNITCIGSQNFTSRGRKNKETSVLPSAMLGNSRFVKILNEWRAQAREVTEEEVDELLSQLTPLFRKHRKIHEDIQAEFDEIVERHEKVRNTLASHRLEELEKQSQIKLAQREVYANIERHPNGYATLMVDTGGDLTNWVIVNADGSRTPYKLKRYSMYPVILADSYRMGFARICKTRITYLRRVVLLSGRIIGDIGFRMSVHVTFPKMETEKKNIIVKLTHENLGSCEFAALFNGESVTIREKSYAKGRMLDNPDYFVSVLEEKLFKSENALEELFRYCFSPFTYDRLGIKDKNVRNYLEGSRFRLFVIQYKEKPILVVARQ